MQSLIFKWNLISEFEWAFVYNFFTAIIVSNLFDNPILFKNNEKTFPIDIMTHNWQRRN